MFQNREDAGRQLSLKLDKAVKEKDFLVVGITRGGVVLGRIIADHFKIALVALVVKKIGAPHNSELAIGAVAPQKTVYLDNKLIKELQVSKDHIRKIKKEKIREVKALTELFTKDKAKFNFSGKQVILVDDGVATGATVLAAQKFLKNERAKTIILAAPIISRKTLKDIDKYFDKVVVLEAHDDFSAVGQFYRDFPQVEDEEVVRILNSK